MSEIDIPAMVFTVPAIGALIYVIARQQAIIERLTNALISTTQRPKEEYGPEAKDKIGQFPEA